jgi:hypothetical protein
MITNMVATGAKKRFSQIKIISAHGGGLPLLRPPSRMVGKPATDRPLFRRKQLLVVFPTSFDKASRERAGHIRSGTQLGSPGYPKRRIGSCFTRLSNKSNHRAMAAHRAEQEREA